jgi:hypothetical protein
MRDIETLELAVDHGTRLHARDEVPEVVLVQLVVEGESLSVGVVLESEPLAQGRDPDAVSLMAELELDVWPLIPVPLELERREELVRQVLVALVINGPEGWRNANPGGEATELLLDAECAESCEVDHSGVLECPPLEVLEVAKLTARGDGEELSLVLIRLVGVLLRWGIALLSIEGVGGVLARARLRRVIRRSAG